MFYSLGPSYLSSDKNCFVFPTLNFFCYFMKRGSEVAYYICSLADDISSDRIQNDLA